MTRATLLSGVLVLMAAGGGFLAGRGTATPVSAERWQRGVVEVNQPFVVWWGYPPVLFTTRQDADAFVRASARFARPEDALTPAQREGLRKGALYPERIRP